MICFWRGPRQAGLIFCLALLWPIVAGAEPLHLQHLDRLASKAKETTNISLPSQLLELASKFLAADDPEQADVKKLVTKLRGVYVRAFEFAKAGEYTKADLDAIRQQLPAPAWQKMVDTRGKEENVDIYVTMKNKDVDGLVLLVAEPLELTVVNIDGPIDLESLAKLSGSFGIPPLHAPAKGKTGPKQE